MRCLFCVLICSLIPAFTFGQVENTPKQNTNTIIEYDTVYLVPDTIRKTNTYIIQQKQPHDTIYREAGKKHSLLISACFSSFNLKSDVVSQPDDIVRYSGSPSFYTGLQISYIQNRLMFQTGVLFNYLSSNKTESRSFPSDGSTVSPDPGSSLQLKYTTGFHNRFYYADIPLMVGYFQEWKSFSIHFSAGPSLFVPLSTSAQKFNPDTRSLDALKASDMKRINSFLCSELGAGYSLNKFWAVTASASFRKLMINDKYVPEKNFQGYLLFVVGITKHLSF
jgi:hypothetical protein